MIRMATLLATLVWTIGTSGAQPTSPAPPDEPVFEARAHADVFRAALARVSPSIVKIETIGGTQPVRAGDEGPAAPAFRAADGPTTGVIWTADGWIVSSSFNFIRDPSIITVTLQDGRQFVARLVARDRPARLSLLKIDARDLCVPELLSRDALRAGQWALVAGYGHGTNRPSLSIGALSALRRMAGLALQLDARTSPANYGGPVFDLDGRLMGVCVPIAGSGDELAGVEWYDSGIAFAIPTDRVERFLPRLQRGEDVHRGVLGILIDGRPPVVSPTSQPAEPEGLRIATPPRGPAVAAGLQAGDLITRIDGRTTSLPLDLRRGLAEKAAGEFVELAIVRDGQTRTVRVDLVREDEIPPEPTSQPG